MKKTISTYHNVAGATALSIVLLASAGAWAEKPDNGSQAKAKAEMMKDKSQKHADMADDHRDMYRDRDEDMEQEKDKVKDKLKERDKDQYEDKMGDDQKAASGLEKQKAKKSEQMQKDAGKGSEQGQASREEHSKKWWKFWE